MINLPVNFFDSSSPLNEYIKTKILTLFFSLLFSRLRLQRKVIKQPAESCMARIYTILDYNFKKPPSRPSALISATRHAFPRPRENLRRAGERRGQALSSLLDPIADLLPSHVARGATLPQAKGRSWWRLMEETLTPCPSTIPMDCPNGQHDMYYVG